MNINIAAAKAVGIGSLALLAASPAAAQTLATRDIPMLSFNTREDRDTWHTVTLISGVVAVVGLVSGDAPLTILGAAGVIVGLVESDQGRFRMESMRRGVDLLQMGPVSLGVHPYTQFGFTQPFTSHRANAYVQLSFKLR